MKAGNLENALWHVMEEDAVFMVILDSDMAPVPEMLQTLLPPMLECRGGTWRPNWRTAFVESPQDFKNIEGAWGADDPMNQANKFFWRILPSSLDSMGFVPFWGTNAAFFVPALKDTRGFVYRCMSEDTVTGAQLHQLGWTSCFVGAALATGLCRESVTETFDQRKRWCQGNIQQLFIEWNPPFILHEDFRNPPYRHAFRQHLQETHASDAQGLLAVPISEDDTGAELRRARRSWTWRLKRQLAYFPTKQAFWYHVQPLYYYAITLAILFNGKPPFKLERSPVKTSWELLDRFYIVLAYWGVCALANFLAYSYVLGDANNPNSPLWRVQQEFWGYAWVRLIGIFEAVASAVSGKQPSWNALGAKGGVNWVYELPIATAFVAMVLSIVVVVVNYMASWHFGAALLPALPVAARVKPGAVLGAVMACSWVLVLMWPVTSCVLADIFRVPYYRLSAILTTLMAATVQVGISVFFFGASLSEDD